MDYTTYSTYSTSTLDGSAVALSGAAFAAMMMFSLIISAIGYAYSGICLYKIFKKANMDKAWAAWVPFYNTWKMFELGDYKGSTIFFSLIPFAGPFIFAVKFIIAQHRIGLKFGKSGEFVLLAIFLSPIWFGILAFGKARINSPVVAAAPVETLTPTSEPTFVAPVSAPEPTLVTPVAAPAPIATDNFAPFGPTIQPEAPVVNPEPFQAPTTTVEPVEPQQPEQPQSPFQQ